MTALIPPNKQLFYLWRVLLSTLPSMIIQHQKHSCLTNQTITVPLSLTVLCFDVFDMYEQVHQQLVTICARVRERTREPGDSESRRKKETEAALEIETATGINRHDRRQIGGQAGAE